MMKFAGMAQKRGGRGDWLYFYLIWTKSAAGTSSLAIHNYTYFSNRYLTLPSNAVGGVFGSCMLTASTR